jgi:hypothetical protein
MRCLKRLVPRARVVVMPACPPGDAETEVIVLDADEVAAGPLAAATALERERAEGTRAAGDSRGGLRPR